MPAGVSETSKPAGADADDRQMHPRYALWESNPDFQYTLEVSATALFIFWRATTTPLLQLQWKI